MKARLIDFQPLTLLAELDVPVAPADREAILFDGGRWIVMRVDWVVVGDGFELDIFVGRRMNDEREELYGSALKSGA